ncbi:MAG TPA: class I SAM-dependent methyltransferase [Anaerolineae bacterium]|nr:class I SAM-dependent methyltransferase [Anaerolineae bacterium]
MSQLTQVSGTAAATAFLRGLAAHDPREDIRGQDTLAEVFLDGEQRQLLTNPTARARAMQQLATGAYEFMLARTAFFDQIFVQALRDQVAQIVLLGAGYDSRAYRFADVLQAMCVFEVDAPPTQQRKRDLLQAANVFIPPQVSFVAIDFETEDLREVLSAAGFDQTQRTMIIWEGVSYYLSAAAVDNVLACITALTPAGSSLAFDYAAISAEVLSDTGVQDFRKLMQARHGDEPARFYLRTGAIDSFLSERGFRIVEHLTADDMTERYLAPQHYPDSGRVSPLFCFVQAEIVK